MKPPRGIAREGALRGVAALQVELLVVIIHKPGESAMRSFIKMGTLVFPVEDFKLAKVYTGSETKMLVEISLKNDDDYYVQNITIDEVYELLSNYETIDPSTDANNLRESLNRIGELEDELETVLGLCDSYQDRLAELNNRNRDEILRLQTELAACKEILGTLPPIQSENISKGIIELQNALTETVMRRDQYEQEVISLKDDLTVCKHELHVSNEQIKGYESRTEKLMNDLTACNADFAACREKFARFEEAFNLSNNRNREDVTRLQNKLAESEAAHNDYAARLQEHEKIVAELHARLSIGSTLNNLDKLRQLVIVTWRKAVCHTGANPGQEVIDELINRVFDL